MLWFGVHLPRLALELFTRGTSAAGPTAVVEGSRPSGRRVWAANAEAEALGIRPGLALSAALALSSRLAVHARDEAAERETLERVACWCGQFTPTASLAPPSGLLLEVGGSLALWGGAERLRERVKGGIGELGFGCLLAAAPAPAAALLLARAGREEFRSEPGELLPALGPLPLELLDLPGETLASLRGLGLRTLGECLGLPRKGLARRFGADLGDLLDRLLGRRPDPRPAFVPPPRFAARLELAAEVSSAEALLFAVHRLLLELSGFLAGRGSGAERLRFSLFHREAAPTAVEVGLAVPSRDPGHLLALAKERLGRVVLPAPAVAVALEVENFAVLRRRGGELFGEGEVPRRDPLPLIERVRARLGSEAVRGIRLLPEHRPERAFALCEPGEGGEEGGPPMPAPGLRPVWLLPEPADLRGEFALVSGPERIESGWWDGADVARDYYVAERPDGARLWVFRELGGGRWFLHGFFA